MEQETSSSERPSVNATLTSSSSCFGNTPATVMDGRGCMKTDIKVTTLHSCTNDYDDKKQLTVMIRMIDTNNDNQNDDNYMRNYMYV